MLMRAGFAGEIQNSGHLLKWNPCGYCAMYFGFKHLQERLEHGLVPNKTFAKKKKKKGPVSHWGAAVCHAACWDLVKRCPNDSMLFFSPTYCVTQSTWEAGMGNKTQWTFPRKSCLSVKENSSFCPASRRKGQGRGAPISMGEIWELSLKRHYWEFPPN